MKDEEFAAAKPILTFFYFRSAVKRMICESGGSLAQSKHTFDIGIGALRQFFVRDAVGLGHPMQHLYYERRLIALPAMRNGSHVGSIGLEDDAIEGHGCWQHLWQVRLLERQHATHAKHETLELEQLTGLLLVAREAVEHAARQVVLIPF